MDEAAPDWHRAGRVVSFLVGAPVLVLSLVGLADFALRGGDYAFGTELGFRYRSPTHLAIIDGAMLLSSALLLVAGFRGWLAVVVVCLFVTMALFLI